MSITELSIRAVRGIRHEVTLKLDGKSWLIHGDNGTGKSSIERALRWALLGTEEPSSGKPFSSEESCRRHILEDKDRPRVALKLSKQGQIEVGVDVFNANDEGVAFRTGCSLGNPFLRRLELLDFLNARPVDRFRYLDSFLDLGEVDRALNEFSAKERTLSSTISASQKALEKTLLNIGHRLPEQFRPKETTSGSVLASLFDLGKHLGLFDGDQRDWQHLEGVGNKAKQLSTGNGLEEKRRRVIAAQEALQRASDMTVPLVGTDLTALGKRKAELEKSTVSPSLTALLEHARKHLDLDAGDICPICGQEIDRAKLLEQINGQLSGLEEYRSLLQQVSEGARTWQAAWREFVRASKAACASCDIRALGEIPGVTSRPSGADLLDDVTLTEEKFQSALFVVGPAALLDWGTAALKAAQAHLKEEIEKLPPASAMGDVRVLASAIETIIEHRTSIETHEDAIAVAEKQQKLVQTVYESMRKSRQDVAQEVLDDIATLVSDYYARIHPPNDESEVTRAPTIEVQRHGGGTAFVRGEFADKSVKDPKWVYSDGHLDTVGICIFLALRRYRAKSTTDPKLMVLDDVVLSIDLGHARRLIQLLRDEFADHQLLIFTHNGLFARWCLGLMPGLKKLEVRGWSLEGGPRISDYASTIDRLTTHISDSSPKEIAMAMMWLMDEWLAEARFAYTLSVPAKYGDEYTLTEIWEPFCASIRKLGKLFGDELLHVTKLLDELRDLPKIRNMLAAHDNEFAQEFPRTVIGEIASNTIVLIKSLYCIECHSFAAPMPSRHSPQMLTCRCEAVRHIKPSKAGQAQSNHGTADVVEQKGFKSQ